MEVMAAHSWNPHILFPQSAFLLYIDFGLAPKDNTWYCFDRWRVIGALLQES